ncbi:MAG: ATP-binding cassette domain-containing protein [Paludibacteraceae bacterium]|nr:ATP-binding cassette domain-containing protein [Paludibacteraceae bacterium]MBO7233652.1 ATP-binding cassette domain-containing protein [Paludibacteraceae bacterium]MBO7259493.1 ATP-binding cassette domain-containing protein [Paludibacteraceae bacterium]
MSIEIKALQKDIGKRTILTDINFYAGSGEIVGLLGPNGAGKTTLMRTITGAYQYQTGSVKVCGMEVSECPQATAAKIGYLPEHNALYDDMYVQEYLLYAAGLKKVSNAHERVETLIREVGLTPERHKKISALSKGYRQRVGIAQALMSDPEVLILDEPTTGLDPNQLEEIRSLIKRVGQNRTVLLSTHIMQEVKEMCTRAVVINHGRFVADLPDLSLQQENGYMLDVQFKRTPTEEEWNQLPQIDERRLMSSQLWRIGSKEDIREALFAWAVQCGNPLLHVSLHTRSIEDIFRETTLNKD